MARRRSSALEDFLQLVAMLPPWAGLLLAVVLFLVLHYLSLRELPAAQGLQNAPDQLFVGLTKMLASVGKIVLPALCVIGAIVSFFKRRKRQALVASTRARNDVRALLELSWKDFERLTCEAFRERGFRVTETGQSGPDGGVDLVAQRDDEMFLVQCKQWRAQKVGVDVVRELYGVMAARGATGGFVVSAGDFTRDARDFAEGRNIELLDGTRLLEIFGADLHASAPPAKGSQVPSCPACGEPMVSRRAQRGANAGQQFWGCSTYPTCRGTRPN